MFASSDRDRANASGYPAAVLAERLAARTLELVDIPSESHDEAALGAHVTEVLRAGGVAVRDAGDGCIVAGVATDGAARILLAGHLDTVPVQGNRPGRRDGDVVHGLGSADMKGGLAVMVELALAGAPFGFVFFPREELPFGDSSLTPLLERDRTLRDSGFGVVLEPTVQRGPRGLPGQRERDVDVPRAQRPLRPPLVGRQRYPPFCARRRRAGRGSRRPSTSTTASRSPRSCPRPGSRAGSR